MNVKRVLLGAVLVALLISFAHAGEEITVGEAVYAEWVPNGWYHGKIAKSCEAGWYIAFDDGDRKCCTKKQIVKDIVPKASKVKAGVKVLAQWGDKKFYPGTVAVVGDGDFAINFDDGDKGKVKLAQIRLR